MEDNLLANAVEDFFGGRCTPQRVRGVEDKPDGEVARTLWAEVQDSGFLDALMAEADGGAGLSLGDAAIIAIACGRHAMPLPMALTLAVRAKLAASNKVPDGSITIAATSAVSPDGPIVILAVPYGLVADWVLLCTPSSNWLVPTGSSVRQRSGGRGSVAADIQWSVLPTDAIAITGATDTTTQWRATAAALVAAQMAGAMERLLDMTISYANDRSQFGKPIGKLQAIQQQVSMMAEQVFAARTAALIGLSAADTQVDPMRAAIAKARAGEAAVIAVAVSHAVHGAIGVTEEFDLQLYTRRLHEWRGQYGGETYWHQRLGMALFRDTVAPLEFVQKLANAA